MRSQTVILIAILLALLFSGCTKAPPTPAPAVESGEEPVDPAMLLREALVFGGLKEATVDVSPQRVLVTYEQPPVRSELDALTAWLYIMGAAAKIAPESGSIEIVMLSGGEPLYQVSVPTDAVQAMLDDEITMDDFRSQVTVRSPLKAALPMDLLATMVPTTAPPTTTLSPTTTPPLTTAPPTTTPLPTTAPPTTTPPPTKAPPTTTPPPTTAPLTSGWTTGSISMDIVTGPYGDHNFFDFSQGDNTTSFEDGDVFFNDFGDIMGECNQAGVCTEIKEETALSFGSMTEPPASGYDYYAEGIASGKRYWIKTLEGNYGKMEITYVSEDGFQISFNWGYMG